VVGAADEVAARAKLEQAGLGLDAAAERLLDRVDADRFLGLLVGQPHIQEPLAVQRVEQEAVLRDGQQHRRRVRQQRLHPQAEHHVRQLLAVQAVEAEVGRTELGLEMREGARPAALADGEHVLLDDLAAGRLGVERLGDQLDLAPLAVGQLEQAVLDVGDADVARADAVQGVRPGRPHLGEVARGEQEILHLPGQLEELAALDGDHLLAAHVAFLAALPHHLAAGPLPAAVVDPDRHPRPHQVGQLKREGQADRPAAADGDPQYRGCLLRLGHPRGRGGHRHRAGVQRLEAEQVGRDHDLVTRAEPVRAGDQGAVHLGAVGAAPVGDDEAVRLLPQLCFPRQYPMCRTGFDV